MSQFVYLPNIPVQYKINNQLLKSSAYTDTNGMFSIQLYQGDDITIYVYDNDNNYIPIHVTYQQIQSGQLVDINLLRKNAIREYSPAKRPESN